MKERSIIAKEWRDENGILHRREVGQELVRCRNCEYWSKITEAEEGVCERMPISQWFGMDGGDYCSKGRRRTDE